MITGCVASQWRERLKTLSCQLVAAVLFAAGVGASSAAAATEVAVAGTFGNKAVLIVNDGSPKTVAVGQSTPDGVRLVAVEGDIAVLEFDGKRERIRLGERVVHQTRGSERATVYIEGDARGHFVTNGQINGAPIRFLVDTGASMVSFGRSDAIRFGIDFMKGREAFSQTANGPARVWLVKLDAVRLGDVVLNDVEGAVHDTDLPVALLGMSFLNRMEMVREGRRLRLRRLF